MKVVGSSERGDMEWIVLRERLAQSRWNGESVWAGVTPLLCTIELFALSKSVSWVDTQPHDTGRSAVSNQLTILSA